MRILLWSDAYPPCHGGLEQMVQTLARGLSSRGHTVLVVTSHFDGLSLPSHDWDGSVEIRRFPLQPALVAHDAHATLANIRHVSHLKHAFRPDLVHVHSEAPGTLVHLSTLAAWPCPTLLTLHGDDRAFATREDSLLGKLFADAAHISTVSRSLLDALHRSAPAVREKSSVIYNAVPWDFSAHCAVPPPRADTPAPVLFAAGRLSSEKGFDVLLTAFARLQRSIPGARLLLAGEGPGRLPLEEYAAQLGILDSVSFLGWLPSDALAQRMAHADAVVIPSRGQESFGLVALEAAMLAVPVVATRVGGLPEVVQDGVTGLLVPPEDPEALCQAMRTLLQTPELRQRFGEAARTRAALLFSLDGMLDGYEAMYRGSLTRHGGAPLTPRHAATPLPAGETRSRIGAAH